jgi:hypothetical protein
MDNNERLQRRKLFWQDVGLSVGLVLLLVALAVWAAMQVGIRAAKG